MPVIPPFYDATALHLPVDKLTLTIGSELEDDGSGWTQLSGDGVADGGLAIAFPQVAGSDFYYGFGGTESHWFGTDGTQFEIDPVGNLATTGTLAAGNTTINGKVIIEGNDAEVLLVRKDGDAGDIFTIDTVSTPHRVTVAANVAFDVGTLTLDSGAIVDSSGAISFSNENLSGTGTLGFGAITGTSLNVDATIDHAITDATDDLVITNANEDKDIKFTFNDGGATRSILIDSSANVFNFGATSLYSGSWISVPEIYNTAGDLKIVPDIQGDVYFFGDTDVANATTDGKAVYIYRKAAEGDSYLKMFGNQYQSFVISAVGGDLSFKADTDKNVLFSARGTGSIYFKREGEGDVEFFHLSGSGDNAFIKQAGYITAAGDERWISWQVEDANDYFVLDREDANILGFKINMPTVVLDKLAFTQTDLNEYIDSLADGYMDYGATTGHRFNANVDVTGTIQSIIADAAGVPCLTLDQNDISEGYIDFLDSGDQDRGVIASTTNSLKSVRVEFDGTVYRLALYADA